jgi:hypothetical protein
MKYIYFEYFMLGLLGLLTVLAMVASGNWVWMVVAAILGVYAIMPPATRRHV